MAEGLLSGFQALDLTDEKGFTCGQILASLGVETIVVENPIRNLSREIPPFVKGSDKHESLYWRAFNRGKRSITLNLETPRGKDLFLKLAEKADFVLESFIPGYLESIGLDYEVLERTNPHIVMASITPFGQDGPHARYHASELIVSAMSGVMVSSGDSDRPPLKEGPDIMFYSGGAAAALATMIAHNHRQLTGEGQHVDVSLQEVAALRPTPNLMLWEFEKRLLKRNGAIRNLGAQAVRWVWPCKDGYIFWNFVGGPMGASANRAISQWMDDDGMENPLREVKDWRLLDMASLTIETFEWYERAIGGFFLRRTIEEIREEGLKRGINACPVDTCARVFENEQLRTRNYWTSPPEGDRVFSCPRHYFLCNNTENFLTSPAPSPGEANAEIYARLDLAEMEIGAVQENERHLKVEGRKITEQKGAKKQPLEGLKVLDFGWALAGSLMSKYLADHGAEVIKVESVTRLDVPRTNRIPSNTSPSNPDDKPWFTHFNTSKYSLAINLKHPSAMGIIEKLIARTDVIGENFTPGTMAKMGLDYERIRAIKPDIIMVSQSGYGQTGPMAGEWANDGTGAALSGYLDLTGWPDRSSTISTSPYGDAIAPFLAATAVIAAVDYRRRTGKGQYIDTSMIEVCVHASTPWILDWQANAHLQSRRGNRVDHAAPHGVFPCKGDDRWCAIAIFTDGEWQTLCSVMGNLTWTRESKFATLSGRKKHEDELEKLISEWSQIHSREELMEMLQSMGIAAGIVQTAEDILDHDPHMRERELFVPLQHPVIGASSHPMPPFKMSKTTACIRTSPCLGEHTEYICTKLLDMKDEEFIALMQDGLFA